MSPPLDPELKETARHALVKHRTTARATRLRLRPRHHIYGTESVKSRVQICRPTEPSALKGMYISMDNTVPRTRTGWQIEGIQAHQALGTFLTTMLVMS